MTEIIGVRFKSGGKVYYFNPNGQHVDVGQSVIIETSKGVEFGECAESNTMVDELELVSTLRPMLRIATEEDLRTVERNARVEKEAHALCQKKIAEHKLDMKLVEVKYSFDGSKLLFFFTSDERVDFRALVKDLASTFHTRIELRQIGVRDEAKLMGGLGICGRPYCCNQFLADFQPVSIKMAKTQNISLNPTKISGACGRLMCCLKYEQDTYEALLKTTPKLESLVKTPDGVGTVNAVQLLAEQVRVSLEDDPENPRTYRTSELEILRNGKGKRLPQPPKDADTQGTEAVGEGKPARNAGDTDAGRSVKPRKTPAKLRPEAQAGEGQAAKPAAPAKPRRPRPTAPKPQAAKPGEAPAAASVQGEAPAKKPAPQRRRRVNVPKIDEAALQNAAAQPAAPAPAEEAAQPARHRRVRHHRPRGGGGEAAGETQGEA